MMFFKNNLAYKINILIDNDKNIFFKNIMNLKKFNLKLKFLMKKNNFSKTQLIFLKVPIKPIKIVILIKNIIKFLIMLILVVDIIVLPYIIMIKEIIMLMKKIIT